PRLQKRRKLDMKPYPLDLAPILENFDKNATFWFRDHDLQFVALEKSKLYYLSQHGESFETVSIAFPQIERQAAKPSCLRRGHAGLMSFLTLAARRPCCVAVNSDLFDLTEP